MKRESALTMHEMRDQKEPKSRKLDSASKLNFGQRFRLIRGNAMEYRD